MRCKSQSCFLNPILGVPGKSDGIVDLESKTEVKEQIRVTKESMDKKQTDILQKTAEYQPSFSDYLDEQRELISKTMSLECLLAKMANQLDPTRMHQRPSTMLCYKRRRAIFRIPRNYQFHHKAAYDLTIQWGQIDLEL